MIIFSGTDKRRIIGLLRTNLHALIFHGVSENTRQVIESHLLWMESQSNNLQVDCRLETFPATQTTEIKITASFREEVVQ